jgi:hypothetical protein
VARGKHGAEAARRRYETAIEHIDRLTEMTAEAKLRAKQTQALAAMVPGLQAEIRRLRADLAAVTSPALESERAQRARQRNHYEDRLRRLAVVVQALVDHLEDLGGLPSIAQHVELDHCLGDKWRNVGDDMNRRQRRTHLTSSDDLLRNADADTLRSMSVRRVGERFRALDTAQPGRSAAAPEESR